MRARVWATLGVAIAVGVASLPPTGAGADSLPASVVIDELSYHPTVDGEEFIELANPGDSAFDLTGACFSEGIGGCFADGTSIPAHGFVIAATDPVALATAFPSAPAALLTYTGALSNGGERITISNGGGTLDSVAYDDAAPWPLSPDGSGPSLELIDYAADNDTAAPWRASDPAPTPGAENSLYGQGPPPSFADPARGPVVADAPVAVSVLVTDASSVQLEVTVGFDPPTTTPMLDDGAHGDGAAADGRYGAEIPGQAAGTLVRYRFLATSASGSAALPSNGETRPRFAYVVERPAVSTPLPVVDWYIAPVDIQYLLDHAHTNDYVPAVVAVGDEVYDGVEVRVHGNGRSLPKYSFKFRMPKGHPLVAPGVVPDPVDEFVLDGDPRDSTGVVSTVAMSVYADTIAETPQMRKVHVERNGAAYGLFTFVEESDALWRIRNHLDAPGYQQFDPEGSEGIFVDEGSPDALVPRFEKVAPDNDYADLYELVRAIDSAPTPANLARLRDLFDVPSLVNFLAVGAIVQHWDSTVHNFMLLRDGSTGRWRFVPADLDFTLGQPLNGTTNPVYLKVRAVFPYGPDTLVSALRRDPAMAEMYFRRVRTLADRYLAGDEIADRVAALAGTVAADVAFDRASFGLDHTQETGLAKLAEYLAYRETDLLVDHRVAGEVPPPPTPDFTVAVASATYDAPGGPAHDALELFNPSLTEAVDLSGWTVEGAGTATMPPGTVVPAGGRLTIPGDQEASAGDRPSGTIVAGELADGLDDVGGSLTLRDADSVARTIVSIDALPPLPDPQPARITVEAAADQVEVWTSDIVGSSSDLRVAVTNHDTVTRTNISVTAPGTTCGRVIPSLAPGASTTFLCATSLIDAFAPDRTYVVTAQSGPDTARSDPVQVRLLGPQTSIFATRMPPAPRIGTVLLGPDGDLGAEIVVPTQATAPRWTVVSALDPDRAVPAQGVVVRPTGGTLIEGLEVDRPVRLAAASRNEAGTGARSQLTPVLTPRTSSIWPYASTEALVRGAFTQLDGREPTAAELASWKGRLDAHTSVPALLFAERLSGPAWTATVEPLIRLYLAYYGRPPDPKGLKYWIGRRRAGATLDAISARFAATSEFVRKYGSLSNGEFVTLVYRNVLDRDPDASGHGYWTRRLAAGRSRGAVMTAFSESSEGRRNFAPRVKVIAAWVGLVDRPPTAAEMAPAVDWSTAGFSYYTVVEGIRSSDAYGTRVTG